MKNKEITNHIIIFSHGFGVKKDGRGFFTEIAGALKDAESVMFDYNDVDEEKNQITVKPFSEQVEILRAEIGRVRNFNPEAIVDMICHSQGAVIAALAKLIGIRKIIFIAPPFDSGIERMLRVFESRPGTEINLEGISKLSRQDGSTTLIPPKYWVERKNTNPLELYAQLAKLTELIVINANQDDVLDKTVFSGLDNIEIINLDGNHNFSGDSRKKLLEVIAEKINS